jgi:DNA segregation ATPase FtsK/SpoIIIE-like protein
MKFTKLASTATLILALTLLTGVIAPASHAEVSFDFFYSDLSPHGSWLVSAEYGHVWQPAVYRSGWNPYHDGHWVYTDCGWAWVSDYTWGDVAYHYGTWVADPRYGWVWVPGYTWAPAWVTFRTGPDYIGWAPVPPSFTVGFSTGGISFGASVPVAASAFVFVPTREFAAPRLRGYIVPESRRTTIINNTTIVNNLTVQNNVVINRGPDLRSIEQATRRTFRPEPIERVARVAPFRSFRRDQLAVARDMGGDRVKAAEPISAQQSLPPRMSEQARREYRANPQLSQAPRNDRFRTPTETQAQLQQDRMRQRQPQQEIERQRPQDQRQERAQQERRQQEVQHQREPSVEQQAQPKQEIQRQRPQEQQKKENVQPERRQQDVQKPHPQEQRQEQAQKPEQKEQQPQQPQKPQRHAPKKKNPDDKKNDGGGGTN